MTQERHKARIRSITALYDTYRIPFIRSIQKSYALDEVDAEEVFSVTMTVVWEKLCDETLPELRRGLEEYCYGIGRNIARKFLRDRARYQLDPDDFLLDHVVASTPHDDRAQFEADLAAAFQALEEIGDPCRTLLESFYLKKMDMQSISRVLKYANADSTKTKKYKCLQRFRTLFYKIRKSS
ncbi:MAG: sigma-70 family RNA polymerase sigma factor [Saprospiraceae bacterium]|nr:sigma-70 family RNA polymerase sigma factor [Saprospiraceae bacterium]